MNSKVKINMPFLYKMCHLYALIHDEGILYGRIILLLYYIYYIHTIAYLSNAIEMYHFWRLITFSHPVAKMAAMHCSAKVTVCS